MWNYLEPGFTGVTFEGRTRTIAFRHVIHDLKVSVTVRLSVNIQIGNIPTGPTCPIGQVFQSSSTVPPAATVAVIGAWLMSIRDKWTKMKSTTYGRKLAIPNGTSNIGRGWVRNEPRIIWSCTNNSNRLR